MKVIVIAPSRKTRGGITAVVNAYSKMSLWKNWNCYWVESQIDRGLLLKLLFFIKAITNYLFQLPSAQIVHIHLSQPVSAVRKIFFFIPAYLMKKKVILHFHAYAPESTINGNFRIIYKFMFSRADRIIVLSQVWKDALEKSLGLGLKITIVYNPSVSPQKRTTADDTNRLPHILFAGTLNARKGYSDLLKAFANISPEFPDWTLVFAGNGEINEGLLLAKKLHVDQKVIFKGWVDGVEKEKLFLLSSIFCLPSYAEGFPMALLDAMAYSIPSIATPVGGTLDVFTDREEVLIFNPGDIAQLTNCLRELISDAVLRKKLSINADKIIKQDFTVDAIEVKVNKIYSTIMD
ncbi:glycosyltransferase family 4 protein [Dyadobacter subterraneus]|uniref:Glycosyltransferase family 4 protein n=1 Tax=Dyadobacter subterraneus TaxID=2773304 RepID=A0ABR9WML8_9BACT|nr:glycosyltransferase family 4 protein [Dyadobacter subterraneus]MBE9466623.1 glycosyltransferase family 4 protein [Dyadobacter subterraneus]